MKKGILFLPLMFLALTVAMTLPVLAQEANSAEISSAQGPCSSVDTLSDCVVVIYRWALGLGVLLALVMIIFSGYMYLTAGGNAQQVAAAKERFAGAFIGLIILFAAVLILRTINPDLVKFQEPVLPPVDTSGAAAAVVAANNFVREAQITGAAVDENSGAITVAEEGSTFSLTPSANQAQAIALQQALEENSLPTAALTITQYDVSNPALIPDELAAYLGDSRPSQIVVVLGSLFVYDAEFLKAPTGLETAVEEIALKHFGIKVNMPLNIPAMEAGGTAGTGAADTGGSSGDSAATSQPSEGGTSGQVVGKFPSTCSSGYTHFESVQTCAASANAGGDTCQTDDYCVQQGAGDTCWAVSEGGCRCLTGNRLGPCCQENNTILYATRETAEALKECLGADEVVETRMTGVYYTTAPMYHLKFSNGMMLNAGTIADRYNRNPNNKDWVDRTIYDQLNPNY